MSLAKFVDISVTISLCIFSAIPPFSTPFRSFSVLSFVIAPQVPKAPFTFFQSTFFLLFWLENFYYSIFQVTDFCLLHSHIEWIHSTIYHSYCISILYIFILIHIFIFLLPWWDFQLVCWSFLLFSLFSTMFIITHRIIFIIVH